jgi:hypothetical protein
MKPLKRDVISFLDKVESKAKSTVKSKYESLINKEQSELITFADPYASILKQIEVSVRQVTEQYKQLQELARKALQEGALVSIGRYNNQIESALSNMSYIDKPVARMLNSYITPSIQELNNLCENEVKKIQIAYEDIRQKVKSMKNMDRAVKYLKELGFDTKSLEVQPMPYDEKTLFPCKFQEGVQE